LPPAAAASRLTRAAAAIGRASAPAEVGVPSLLDAAIAALMDDPTGRGVGGDPATW